MPLRELPILQDRFLDLFGIVRGAATWRDVALNDAMTSASRRTRLYKTPSNLQDRRAVRAYWRELLDDKLAAYQAGGASFASEAQYEHDIMDIRAEMNATFPTVFLQRPVRTFEPGFRIAHAQKSLSLVLKHGWCNGTVEMPPQCVVDRRILRVARAGQAEQRWTDVNTWNNHLEKIAIVEGDALRHADWPLTLAEWELWAFAQP